MCLVYIHIPNHPKGKLKKINTSRYWTRRGSNPRPLRYKHNALTYCATGPYTYLPYINICLSCFKRIDILVVKNCIIIN